MSRIPAWLLLALVVVLRPSLALAHSDMEKPVFVSLSGVDEGRCLDPAAPCRTISYALTRVGKGGQVRVAGGEFEISEPADLFQVISGVTDIRGGFDASDQFRRPGVTQTTLTGVPAEFRSLLGSRDFHVIADRKGLDKQRAVATSKMLALHDNLQAGALSATCSGGMASGLACENADLLSHTAFADVSGGPGAGADIWGFVDLNTNREYAIMSYNNGTAVFDVTDPGDPAEVGFIPGQNTVWRDIKVYQFFNATDNRWNAYAYVTADGISEGLFVIDLTGLPHAIRRVAYAGDFGAAHNVFAASTDYGTGLSLTGASPSLIIAGSNNGGGRFRVYSLATPAAPSFVTLPGFNDYMHDAASMIIRDSRKDTQCVNATDYCEVLFDFNESTVDVWDITNLANPVRLSRTPYSNAAYTHSGWPSEDGQYLFVHDEIDEQRFGLQTTVRTFSLADLANPLSLAGTWTGPTSAIDHNGFVRGNRYYMSNYSRGLTILDTSNPASLQPIGRLDTYPFSDNANFVGAWGVYPFFHSGTIAVSDMNSGLYMVGDDTLNSPNGRISLAADAFGNDEGGALNVTLSRRGGASGNVGVDVTLVPGTADSGDLVGIPQAVTWADGDTADKVLVFTPVADGIDEGLERMLLKVLAPTGGATLGPTSVASLYISDPGSAPSFAFDSADIAIAERGFGKAIVAVHRRGSAVGAASVDFMLANGDATENGDFVGTTTGTISWADGDANPKTLVFDIVDDGAAEGDEFFELTLAAPSGGTIGATPTVRVTILDGTGSNQAPNAVAGPSQTVATGASVTLSGGSSNDPDGDALSYQWAQELGSAVAINNADSAVATFTAPSVTSDTLLRFRLVVTDPAGLSDATTTSVTVTATSSSGSGGGGGAVSLALICALLVVLAGRRQPRRAAIRTGAA